MPIDRNDIHRVILALGVLGFVWSGAVPVMARNASEFVPEYAPLRSVAKQAVTSISSMAPPGRIVLKFHRGTVVDEGINRLEGEGAKAVRQVFSSHGLGVPTRTLSGDVRVLQEKRMAAEDRSRTNLPDMTLYFEHKIDDPVRAATIIDELNARPEVEIAYFAPRPEVASRPPAPYDPLEHSPYALATTPNWEASQDYIDAAPDGVDAVAAWTLPGGDGTGTRVIDIEYGWQLSHEDLSKGASAVIIGVNTGDNDHGTAVLGEMVADQNSYGMTGIAYNADIGISSVATLSFADAMNQAALALDPGDCVLIELHSPGPRFDFESRDDQRGYIPMEYFPANFDAILNAWALGVIVCEAAGNGQEDLDDPIYESLFDTTVRNSHAIMCGAGNPPAALANDRSKLGFSNWGQRVDLQGYGTLVFTTGYGNLYNGGSKDSWYTGTFSGTSSASPIVTGAVLSVSGVFRQMLGTVVDADSIRNLLVATGSPQQAPLSVYHIGPRPDLGAALGLLFDPIDTIQYGELSLDPGTSGALPIALSNSHAVTEIHLPFDLSGDALIQIDSLTRSPRTAEFGQIHLEFDNRFFGQAAYVLRAAGIGGNSTNLPAGDGTVAFLWVTASGAALPGEVAVVDSAWLGISSHLRLVSHFDDGYPDGFTNGAITITGQPCDCSLHGDLNGDGVLNVIDVVGVVGIAFRNNPPAATDPACPHATRADYDCSNVINVLDAVRVVDVAFRNGPPPCDPCGI